MENNYENINQEEGGKKTLWIIGGIILVVAIIAVVYGATQKTLKKNTDTNTDGSVTMNEDGTTVLGADRVVVSGSTVTAMDVVNLQTFPYKVQARIKGTVPDSCSTFDTPKVTSSGKTFTITVTASHPKDAVCAQVVTDREVVIDLPVAGLAAGTYTVKVGATTKTFTLATNNTIEYSGDK